MRQKESKNEKELVDNDKRKENLKVIYCEGKRILNNMVDSYKKWLTYSGIIIIFYSLISILLYLYFDEKDIRTTYFYISIFYSILGLMVFSIGYFIPWLSLKGHKDLTNGSNLNLREWYEFFNKVDFKEYKEKKYGLAEIFLRIYYNIDIWLRVEYRINLMDLA